MREGGRKADMRLWGFSFMVQKESEFGESFNGNKILTRSCVIVHVVVSVGVLYQYRYQAVDRNGER